MKSLFFTVAFIIIISISPVYAANDGKISFTVEQLAELSASQRTQILDSISDLKKSGSIIDSVGNAEATAKAVDSIAGAISGTIKTICQDLGVTVNEFIATPAGKFTIAIVGYKIVRNEAWGLIKGFVFIVPSVMIWWLLLTVMLYKFHGTYKDAETEECYPRDENGSVIYEKDKNGKRILSPVMNKVTRTISRNNYEWNDNDDKFWSMMAILFGYGIGLGVIVITVINI